TMPHIGTFSPKKRALSGGSGVISPRPPLKNSRPGNSRPNFKANSVCSALTLLQHAVHNNRCSSNIRPAISPPERRSTKSLGSTLRRRERKAKPVPYRHNPTAKQSIHWQQNK